VFGFALGPIRSFFGSAAAAVGRWFVVDAVLLLKLVISLVHLFFVLLPVVDYILDVSLADAFSKCVARPFPSQICVVQILAMAEFDSNIALEFAEIELLDRNSFIWIGIGVSALIRFFHSYSRQLLRTGRVLFLELLPSHKLFVFEFLFG